MIFSKPLYYIFNVKDHSLQKEKILAEIDKFDYPHHHPEGFVSNSNWGEGVATIEWFNFSFSARDKLNYQKFIQKKFKKNYGGKNIWFNQYYPHSGSEHNYHDHIGCSLANIYYVELEDKSLRTILKHPKTGKEIVPRVKEGQILMFNGKIMHRSPQNYTNTTKTVVSFNIDFI